MAEKRHNGEMWKKVNDWRKVNDRLVCSYQQQEARKGTSGRPRQETRNKAGKEAQI